MKEEERVKYNNRTSQHVNTFTPQAVSTFLRPRLTRKILAATTDLGQLAGQRLVCAVDEDNLRISLMRHAVRLSYHKLLQRLEATAAKASAWAVLTTTEGDHRREQYLMKRGWNVVSVVRETVLTVRGYENKSNADLDLAFLVGFLANAGDIDAVLLGTGDGDLAISMARGVKRVQPVVRVYTLSVPGSTCHRLQHRTDLFDGNFLVGCDITRGGAGRRWS